MTNSLPSGQSGGRKELGITPFGQRDRAISDPRSVVNSTPARVLESRTWPQRPTIREYDRTYGEDGSPLDYYTSHAHSNYFGGTEQQRNAVITGILKPGIVIRDNQSPRDVIDLIGGGSSLQISLEALREGNKFVRAPVSPSMFLNILSEKSMAEVLSGSMVKFRAKGESIDPADGEEVLTRVFNAIRRGPDWKPPQMEMYDALMFNAIRRGPNWKPSLMQMYDALQYVLGREVPVLDTQDFEVSSDQAIQQMVHLAHSMLTKDELTALDNQFPDRNQPRIDTWLAGLDVHIQQLLEFDELYSEGHPENVIAQKGDMPEVRVFYVPITADGHLQLRIRIFALEVMKHLVYGMKDGVPHALVVVGAEYMSAEDSKHLEDLCSQHGVRSAFMYTADVSDEMARRVINSPGTVTCVMKTNGTQSSQISRELGLRPKQWVPTGRQAGDSEHISQTRTTRKNTGTNTEKQGSGPLSNIKSRFAFEDQKTIRRSGEEENTETSVRRERVYSVSESLQEVPVLSAADINSLKPHQIVIITEEGEIIPTQLPPLPQDISLYAEAIQIEAAQAQNVNYVESGLRKLGRFILGRRRDRNQMELPQLPENIDSS